MPVDLRSDTVTRPTAAMRRAIAEAVVGDDVMGDDPTTIDLERRVAALCGKEAGLFLSSGTMGNQLGIAGHTQPGDQVLIERESHVFYYEQGGLGANCGCLADEVTTERGVITPRMLEAVMGGEPGAFFDSVAADGDRRRICGLSPIYTFLRALPGVRGRLIRYSQWPDPEGAVTFCAAAFP